MAETTFKKIAFDDLSANQKALMAANAESFTQIVKDESGRPVINERTGRVETYTPTAEEYYNIRGGVNKSGYFGDAYTTAEQGGRPYLTEEEYNAALQGLTGVARGQAINLATAKKQYDLAISQGKTSAEATAISGYDPATGGLVGTTTTTATPSGVTSTGSAAALAAQQAAQAAAEEKRRQGQSAYDLLFSQFQQYGLGALVEPLKQFVVDGLSPAEFTIRLRDTDAYKKRFAANSQRIRAGLRALSEAEYITLEDQYQNVMRNYGLPESYYTRGDMGVQQGFEKFIAGDVSAAELEDRIQTAQNRVINAAPEVSKALREFYPDISSGDILAYALDPQQALTNIKRKVTAAEIGAGAMQAGLATGLSRAEELARYGVTAQQARQGFQTIGGFLPRATQLGDIYAKSGMGPYTQTTAEAEVFGTTGAVEAEKKRKQLAQLETAQFSGQTGVTKGALARERAGQF